MIEESVYNLIKHEDPIYQRQSRYVSKYPHNIVPTGSTLINHTTSRPNVANLLGDYSLFQGPHQHLGNHSQIGKLIGNSKPNTKKYLLKSKIVKSQDNKQFKYNDIRKPIIPKREEKPLMNLNSNKNFILQNVIENILLIILKNEIVPKNKYVQKKFIQKENYGEVPQYLKRIKKQIHNEYQQMKSLDLQNQQQQNNQRVQLTENEIQDLRQGLKNRWNEVNKEYQTITHIISIDTTGLKRKKMNCEKELTLLEKDIEKLNKPYIFVDHNI